MGWRPISNFSLTGMLVKSWRRDFRRRETDAETEFPLHPL
ncbi:hypothetical protein GGE50_005158 [Rhizobium leguminosarum]|nr:hypothetical protein [Rhizobium leguminosarum]MDH6663802.1 hypothetical protein [Rhizobium sophorae]MBB4346075.1 hypothetical protein [Rhizobium leguminosarum]MBB4358679.1 hypothetical protein [Rhizobium leguminosarum]MBB4390753.1 hypothetical protein [Rhizobium leguminosarum]